jgi:ATP-dependent DNA helicase RecQ
MNRSIDVIVATTTFEMWFYIDNARSTIDYEIASSLDNYLQESIRPGHNQENIERHILYNEEDLNLHFFLLNNNKLTLKEIQQVWKSIIDNTENNSQVVKSALEIAESTGWSDSTNGIEKRAMLAMGALETASFIKLEDDRDLETLSSDSCLTGFIIPKKESLSILKKFRDIEEFFIKKLSGTKPKTETQIKLSDLNNELNSRKENNEHLSFSDFKTIFHYVCERKWFISSKCNENGLFVVEALHSEKDIFEMRSQRDLFVDFVNDKLQEKCNQSSDNETPVEYSIKWLESEYNIKIGRKTCSDDPYSDDQYIKKELRGALMHLTQIGILRLNSSSLLSSHYPMKIDRMEKDIHKEYDNSHYKQIENYYNGKVQQIHIVGDFVQRMSEDPTSAEKFADDCFKLDRDLFIKKYFSGREKEITRSITAKLYANMFNSLSATQKEIVNDRESKYIIVRGCHGCGKTKVLAHKVVSLLMLEDIKPEQLLMLVRSRLVTTEFIEQLSSPEMLGNAANYIYGPHSRCIETINSYCLDLFGKDYSKNSNTKNIAKRATNYIIKSNKITSRKIMKSVLIIDEAQDLTNDEFALVDELSKRNPDMRVIGVITSEQSISSSEKSIIGWLQEKGAKEYELFDNFRNSRKIIDLTNEYAKNNFNVPQTGKSEMKSVCTNEGEVCITLYDKSRNLVLPVVADILNKIRENKLAGSTCILTQMDEDATALVSLLTKYKTPECKISARYIPANLLPFKLNDLLEIRFFAQMLDLEYDNNRLIKPEDWNIAKQKMCDEYKGSVALDCAINMLDYFERLNDKKIYECDFSKFIYESQEYDFLAAHYLKKTQYSEIVVSAFETSKFETSTIGICKGIVFDNVFLVLMPTNQMEYKYIYRGMTRAKNNLYIHSIPEYFSGINLHGVNVINDGENHKEPDEKIIICSHKDVDLGSFSRRNEPKSNEYIDAISKLRCQDELIVEENHDDYLCSTKCGGIKFEFSITMRKRISRLHRKGYKIQSAKVNMIVWWRYKDESPPAEIKETKIILPQILFVKE